MKRITSSLLLGSSLLATLPTPANGCSGTAKA
jgi:hypothetical protein